MINQTLKGFKMSGSRMPKVCQFSLIFSRAHSFHSAFFRHILEIFPQKNFGTMFRVWASPLKRNSNYKLFALFVSVQFRVKGEKLEQSHTLIMYFILRTLQQISMTQQDIFLSNDDVGNSERDWYLSNFIEIGNLFFYSQINI